MKLCINCKHAVLQEGDDARFSRCSYNNPVSLVTGKLEIQELFFCQALRSAFSTDKCGKEGQFYEEKTNV